MKPVNQRAWLLVLPVVACVAFSAILPLMTMVNYSVQDIISPEQRVFVGTEWFRSVMRDPELHEALVRQMLFSLAVLAVEIPLGILLALGRQSDLFIVKTICVGFIEFIRGVPLITLLFTASLLLNYFLPPGTSFDIILRVIIMVTLFAAAYMAEVIRGGLAALPKGQYEGADSLGLNYWQAQRLIILPQALKISIPGIVGTFIGVFKDTTLVSIVGIADFIRVLEAARADPRWSAPTIPATAYAFAALFYLAFCFAMARYAGFVERRLAAGERDRS